MLIWPSRPELQAKGFLLQLQIWTAGDMDLEKNLYTDPVSICSVQMNLTSLLEIQEDKTVHSLALRKQERYIVCQNIRPLLLFSLIKNMFCLSLHYMQHSGIVVFLSLVSSAPASYSLTFYIRPNQLPHFCRKSALRLHNHREVSHTPQDVVMGIIQQSHARVQSYQCCTDHQLFLKKTEFQLPGDQHRIIQMKGRK